MIVTKRKEIYTVVRNGATLAVLKSLIESHEAKVNALLSSIPESYVEFSDVNFSPDFDGQTSELELWTRLHYREEETEEEKALRIAADQRELERKRKQYEELRKEFENNEKTD